MEEASLQVFQNSDAERRATVAQMGKRLAKKQEPQRQPRLARKVDAAITESTETSKPFIRAQGRASETSFRNRDHQAQHDSRRKAALLESRFIKLPETVALEYRRQAANAPLKRPISDTMAYLDPRLLVASDTLSCPRRPPWAYNSTKFAAAQSARERAQRMLCCI